MQFYLIILIFFIPPAFAGSKGYDIKILLDNTHPFSFQSDQEKSFPPLMTVVSAQQIRPPARVPNNLNIKKFRGRLAAQPAASEILPRQTAEAILLNRQNKKGMAVWGLISELRAGLSAHDVGPFSRKEESGKDVNLEVLFVSPEFLRKLKKPKPHLGVNINLANDTNQAYAGLTWEWPIGKNWFFDVSLGGAIHDGKKNTNRIDRKELGCRVLFRESLDLGYKLSSQHTVSVYLDHISNAKLCGSNESIETVGLRFGYRF